MWRHATCVRGMCQKGRFQKHHMEVTIGRDTILSHLCRHCRTDESTIRWLSIYPHGPRGPYKVVGVVKDFDYRVEVSPDKVKTYHINMLKRYYHRESTTEPTFNGSRATSKVVTMMS